MTEAKHDPAHAKKLAQDHVAWFLRIVGPLMETNMVHGHKHGWDAGYAAGYEARRKEEG